MTESILRNLVNSLKFYAIMASYLLYGSGVIFGGAAFLVAAPVVVSGIGFTAGGIAGGSVAASMMSMWAPTFAGGVVATLQSVGAAGLGTAGTAVVSSVGGAVGVGVSAVVDALYNQ